MTGFGHTFYLTTVGLVCPCLLSSEQRNARMAITFINQHCKTIQWHPVASNQQTSFLGGFFSKNANSKSQGNDATTGHTTPCVARLILQDSGGDGQPEIFIDTDTALKDNIQLRKVDKVSLDNESIVLLDAQKSERLRFVALTKNDPTPLSSDTRNLLMHHIMVIVEYERQRAQELDLDDLENEPNFLQARASRTKHYYDREVELNQSKKARERRKAELMAKTNGLKYTALAMAQSGSIQ